MNRFADVVLPIGVDKSFTYVVPPELEKLTVVGARAVVPFGRTHATGLIVGLPTETSVPGLKSLQDIIDPFPVMPPELLKLCRWVAEYYLAPLGEVLKAAIPHGFGGPPRLIVRPGKLGTALAIDRISRTSARRGKILSLALERGRISASELRSIVPLKGLTGALHDMAREGFIELEEVLSLPKVRPRMQICVALSEVDRTRLQSELASMPARRKKAGNLLRAVQGLLDAGRQEIPLRDLLKTSGCSSVAAREYTASGLLPLLEREAPHSGESDAGETVRKLTLNDRQSDALSRISRFVESGENRTLLLHGVTGSGKTQVYIEAIRQSLVLGKSAIVLVPEISLTPQTVRRFRSHFGRKVAVVHSRMSADERHDTWRRALRGECSVVIGPRSAVFAPLCRVGLIVVDEEHETSYKQFDASPRYHARDVAVMRGSLNNAVVVLGSATPSLESYENARSGKFELLEMESRIDSVPMPDVAIVDMTGERRREYVALKESLPEEQHHRLRQFQQSSLSQMLRDGIQERLEKKEGIILLQNRRGFAPFMECPDCGYTVMCEQCSVTLTYHQAQRHLRCHYCGITQRVPDQCPQCNSSGMKLRGIGTQRVESELAEAFAGARVIRMDVDTTTRKGSHEALLRSFGAGEADILLGTQMVAKGLDFPRVTLVGVISADTQMLLPDFRATERTFQLLTQVAGRAGRSALRGEVIIQTYQPEHPLFQHVVRHDFRSFFGEERASRAELDYPPFSRMVLIEARGANEPRVRETTEFFARSLTRPGAPWTVLGPAPAVIARIRGMYRWHTMVKNRKAADPGGALLRESIRDAVRKFGSRNEKSVRVTFDVDPTGVL